MTADRASAYAVVLGLLDALGPAKLAPAEQAVVRDAADALLFTSGPRLGDDARATLAALDDLLDRVVDAERLTAATGDALADAVEGCAPAPALATAA
jgi:hypothetical protein